MSASSHTIDQVDDPVDLKKSATQADVFYVLSTHWDREWFQPFQDFRRRLVALFDDVLPALKDGQLLGPFTCDGQAIILEDYLEIRRSQRPLVEALAREGKLSIGPWYVMPDEFLVAGESLIRNLRYGRQVAREFGALPSSAGFVNDMFGHISQLPQIFAGFGIFGGLIWRGTNCYETRWVRWRGADGTELPCYRFFDEGYGAFAIQIRRASDFARGKEDHFDPANKEHAERFEAYIAREIKACAPLPALIFDGSDHLAWGHEVYGEVRRRIESAGDGRAHWRHTSLDDFLRAALQTGAAEVPVVLDGELREPARHPRDVDDQWLIPGVLSSRVWIKQANDFCEALLCQWAEPLGLLGQAALGIPYPADYLNESWRWLLQNHPHDSMCACSIDAVHEDMKYRFTQATLIAEATRRESAGQLTAVIEGEIAEGTLRLNVFNPLTVPVDEVVALTVEIPTDWPFFQEWFGYEQKPAFRLIDPDGNEIPYQRLAQAPQQIRKRVRARMHPEAYQVTAVTVAITLQIPALGYSCLRVERGEAGRPTRYAEKPGLASSRTALDNGVLGVAVESNGTLTLTDHRNGNVYRNLMMFEDMADIGDGWYHASPVNDSAWVSVAAPAQVALVHDGPLQATLAIRSQLRLPARFDFTKGVRSNDVTELEIESFVTLRKNADRVEVETRILNNIEDHRLRVLFPTDVIADSYLADGTFDVLERPIALRADNHLYREPEVATKPQRTWTAVQRGERGLAVVAGVGLHESAVLDEPARPIALTLYRATRRTIMTTGEPGGELLGPQNFHYVIVPLAAEPDRPALCRLGQQLAAGWLVIQQDRREQYEINQSQGSLPARAEGLHVEGAVVVTSLSEGAKGPELRLFNPTAASVQAQVCVGMLLSGTLSAVTPVDFESNEIGDKIAAHQGVITVTLPAKSIRTYLLHLKSM